MFEVTIVTKFLKYGIPDTAIKDTEVPIEHPISG
jgi:hypothetical protein